MKKLTIPLLIFTLAFSILLMPNQHVQATSNHTIPIDGNNSDWNSDEAFDVGGDPGSQTDDGFFTWDSTHLYFGIDDEEADYGNLATFMYIDTDPKDDSSSGFGSSSGWLWNGENVALPFKADYTIVWKNQPGADYIELRTYDEDSGWVQTASSNSTALNGDDVSFAIGGDYREVRIKRSLIGNPQNIKIVSLTQQQWSGNWKYYTFPSDTVATDADIITFDHFYGFVLLDGISPNSPVHKDAYVDASSGSSSDFNNPTAWLGGANISLGGTDNTTLYIRNGHNLTISANSQIRNLVIQSGGTLDVGSSTFNALGSITNNGTLQQTLTANMGTTTEFLRITDGGGTDKYFGVDITIPDETTSMGSTTVKVRGNSVCTSDDTSGHVHRCFDITPTTSTAADVTFYYLNSEINGNTAGNVQVWHWKTGVGWLVESGTTYGTVGSDYQRVKVTGVDEYSPFVLDDVNPGSPTAITLSEFAAQNSIAPVWIFAGIATFALILGGAALRRKRPSPPAPLP